MVVHLPFMPLSYSLAHWELDKTFLHIIFVEISHGGWWRVGLDKTVDFYYYQLQVYMVFKQSLFNQHGPCGFVYNGWLNFFFFLEAYRDVELEVWNVNTEKSDINSHEESCVVKGSWGVGGKKQAEKERIDQKKTISPAALTLQL